ncbi:hypothetical protein SERLA73DRAFT_144450 [Serpula lacrymans var. lacrymans S7.3]|uniref:Uncharacterized protein n=2 Tax=Serpula lacrymans var. lacrymans TaxID=341189 RepID=F8QBM5_SERL3|nr:uncharacterized protein SERLADRAFT_401630 [Serpula lacrymans var. lacrymans S7.9]EGN94611.1 hypothetical protein SERLA73DRAFT_144450 [Serpula lacrymans var. lacrymans S7.3]EGO20089.1 hypothetical protein SERLADRAFT_401630 [Serpula lacrymans var. lacrymans S7.9]
MQYDIDKTGHFIDFWTCVETIPGIVYPTLTMQVVRGTIIPGKELWERRRSCCLIKHKTGRNSSEKLNQRSAVAWESSYQIHR